MPEVKLKEMTQIFYILSNKPYRIRTSSWYLCYICSNVFAHFAQGSVIMKSMKTVLPSHFISRKNSVSHIGRRCVIMLLRFTKKSSTSSPEVDIDVEWPNIDVEHCWKNREKLRNYLEHRNGRPLFLKLETKYEERSQRSKAEAKEYGSK